jgi:hypothetical protein
MVRQRVVAKLILLRELAKQKRCNTDGVIPPSSPSVFAFAQNAMRSWRNSYDEISRGEGAKRMSAEVSGVKRRRTVISAIRVFAFAKNPSLWLVEKEVTKYIN